ncbi:MAG: histidine phosphatase family protein [Chloroflexi bacterium]|nr:histidine phosphatase family protein [Chloroflexota bacterium]MBU1746903.1 histidine phosphatase family protein [Chloroflexota bacterium]MBU1878502.1 histidine phosphatase family protein [Chloroflexota bacterium]
MTTPTVIHLVRHGLVHNPQAIFYGRLPGFPLSDEGRKQAQAAATALRDRPLAAIWCSPMLRTQQTAEAIRAAHDGLVVQTAPLLIEVHCAFEGRPHSEAAARDWDVYTGAGPEFEQPADILARTRQFIAQVRRQYTGQQVAAVTHGDVIAFTFLWIRGVPLMPPTNKQTLDTLGLSDRYPAPASITTLVYQTADEGEIPGLEYTKPYR